MELNGIAHIQLTANDAARSLPFWERLCHFFEMKTLLKNESIVYCIGSRTGGACSGERVRTFHDRRSVLATSGWLEVVE